MSQMFWGSRCTNHSAVVRAKLEVPHLEELDLKTMPSAKLISIGLARRNPILAVTQRVIERAEQMNLSTRSPQEAAEQLSVWLCTVKWMIDLQETAEERLRLIQVIVTRGLNYSQARSDHGAVVENFLEPFKELMLEEVSASVLLGRTPSTSLSQYTSLFGQQTPPDLFTIPPDFDFVFSGAPEPSEVRKVALNFQNRWLLRSVTIYHHLFYLLAYTPKRRLRSVVTYCWKRLEAVLAQLQTCFDRIHFDPRFDPQDIRPRPKTCAVLIISSQLDALSVLRACHVSLERYLPNAFDLLEESEDLWFQALTRSTSLLKIFNHFSRLLQSQNDLFVASTYNVDNLRMCPASILKRWAQRFSAQREELIEELYLASYGMPDACRLILLLKSYQNQG